MVSTDLVSSEKSGAAGARLRHHLLILTAVFIVTLPLINPLVHGDGIGYYAYLRAPIIQHNLRFEQDWLHGNLSFIRQRLDGENQVAPDQYTSTGHINNLFTIGPAILWSPFFVFAHATVLLADGFGANIPADGFSLPYRVLVAFGSAFYAFCGLLLSYLLARRYVDASWALLATLAIWGGSSLPVYMYFNPFWSHAHSVFVVALFLWYWDRTRPSRKLGQWALLGLISGLMLDVYFVNGVFLIIPLVESIQVYLKNLRSKNTAAFARQFGVNLIFLATIAVSFWPTLITRKIVFGGMLRFGSYTALPWDWHAPYWFSVLFSSEHGLLSWTPLLGIALLGLFLPFAEGRRIKYYLALGAVAFYYVISCYPYWNGMASFGNRFFISLTPIFVMGLALLLERAAKCFRTFRLAYATQSLLAGLLVLWNLAFIFQWGMHMVPTRGKIPWGDMAHNQFVAVPARLSRSMETYFLHRNQMIRNIEQKDIQEQKSEEQKSLKGPVH